MFAIIDGSYYMHRTLHQTATKRLRTSGGEYSGGIFGFLRSVSHSLNLVKATRAVCVWDGAKSSRRMSLYPAYKVKVHKPDPDGFEYLKEFRASRAAANEILPKLGVRVLTLKDREGDDAIYRVKRSIKKWYPGGRMVVLSEDRDMWQLVDADCAVYRPYAEEWITRNNHMEKVGLAGLDEYLMWRALVGDSSDNIDGVSGVGDVRAKSIIVDSRDVQLQSGLKFADALMRVAKASKAKWAKSIVESWEVVQRNLELVDLRKELITAEEKAVVRQCVRTPCSAGSPAPVLSFLAKYELAQLTAEFDSWWHPFRALV